MKRFIALLLVISIVFTFVSCTGKDNNETSETTAGEYVLPTKVINSDISFPYTSAADFNPYTTRSSLNRDLIPVLYESLYIADDSGKGIPQLASSADIDGNKVTVKLSQGIKFSDGTEFVSDYVKSSFEKAKTSAYYKKMLSVISSVTAPDNYTVVFNFTKTDPMALNVLSFPVTKTDGKTVIGTGKYYIDYLEKTPYLAVNKNHRDYKNDWNKEISLYDMAGISSPVYPFKANEISVYKNDLSDGEYINLSSATVSVGLDNLVYAGINTEWSGSVTSIDWVRQAINIGIDRTAITASSYLGQGTAAVTPFKSDFYGLEDVEITGVTGNTEKAIGILERHGYTQIDENGVRSDGNSSLRVSIIVCTKNQYKLTVANSLKEQLEKLGFGVTVTEYKKVKDFNSAVKKGKYGFFIGETELTPNCDLTEFLTSGGKLSYGISDDIIKNYKDYMDKGISVTQFIETFSTDVPFLPLFYRKAVVSVNPNIKGTDASVDLYSSVSDWEAKKNK